MISIKYSRILERVDQKQSQKGEVIQLLGRERKKKHRRRDDTITHNLPPYLWDLIERKEAYPDWKPRYIKNSRTHLLKIKDWLESKDRGKRVGGMGKPSDVSRCNISEVRVAC